ncbi:hypothetical protein [Marivita sp. GX14005]|uniref:hypothetical protein n=1 Tax=Marivita sp. GX14005 TaxID=2942276 RepID=UPI0020188C69|nr:hypothetical protein [Marivita sp. GX14005]MCL3882306.1 hypothetical protein [Marivita sp. GX14005]
MTTRSITAGLTYGLAVFMLGFALGVLRTIMLHPLVGELWAVALEIPIILAAAWAICAAVLHRFRVAARWPARLAMGGVALFCVLIGEAGVSLWMSDRTLKAHLALYATPRSALGLLAQFAFVLFPALQLRRR